MRIGTTTFVGNVAISDKTLSRYSIHTEEVTGTSRSLTAADNGKQLIFSNASAITVTVPTGLPVGFNVMLVQGSTGQITVSGSGVTLRNRSSQFKSAGQDAILTLLQGLTTTIYRLAGDTVA